MEKVELLVGIAIVLLFVGAVLPAVYTHIFTNPATPIGTSDDEGSHSLSLEETTIIDGVTIFVKDVVDDDTAVFTLSYQDGNYKNVTADEGDLVQYTYSDNGVLDLKIGDIYYEE